MRIVKALLPVAIASFSVIDTNAQHQGEVFKPDTNWKVIVNGAERTMAWGGGFNNPQFAQGDLNNDGIVDLVVFEKGSMQVKTFINYGTQGNPVYKYRQQYERNFPVRYGERDVRGYMKLVDYNCDNVPDLVHRGYGGFAVHRGHYSNNELHFTYYKDLLYSPLTQNSEDFEFSNFPPFVWKVTGAGWSRQTSGTNPTVIPQSGSAMAQYNSRNIPSGNTALLISKRFRISHNLGANASVSFWMYRDNNYGSNGDSISVYLSHDTTLNNAVYVNRVARSTSINQPDTKPGNGWYKYTFPLPSNVYADTLRLIFKATSRGGNNMFIDNVSWISSPPVGDVNAYVEPGGDIPEIVDIDGDGDLDFFAFNIGGGHINYYKNYQVEDGMPCDSIRINFKDGCWGRTYQGFTMEQTLGVVCPTAQPVIDPLKTTHTGNTLCFLDADGDEDYDYLNGGVTYNYIQFVKNGKSEYNYVRDTMIAQDTAWQTGGHVFDMTMFPAAFWMDVDHDGKKDVVIAPVAEGGSENYKCVVWYKNTGTPSAPVFTYQHDSLYVEQTIDMGTASRPMMYDYNKDGKPDLFIGGEGFFQKNAPLRARISYYMNTSSGNNLSFTLQTTDFLGIDALNVRGAFPAVGDLDNDGKDDLVVGHSNGTITFYKNQAPGDNVQPQWQLTHMVLKDINNVDIDSSQSASPFIYDMNKDGKKDLLIGGQGGWLAYYENVGISNELKLQHQTSKLGNVKVDGTNIFSAYSVPFVGKMDNTGVEFLMLGSNSGRMHRFTGFQNGNVTTPYTMVDSVYSNLNVLLGKWSGYRSAPAIADLDGDGWYEMVVGNVSGGVYIFKQGLIVSDVKGTEAANGGVDVYPNPATNVVYVNWGNNFANGKPVEVAIYTITGQKQLVHQTTGSEQSMELSTRSLAPGTYLCVVTAGSSRKTSRLVIMK